MFGIREFGLYCERKRAEERLAEEAQRRRDVDYWLNDSISILRCNGTTTHADEVHTALVVLSRYRVALERIAFGDNGPDTPSQIAMKALDGPPNPSHLPDLGEG